MSKMFCGCGAKSDEKQDLKMIPCMWNRLPWEQKSGKTKRQISTMSFSVKYHHVLFSKPCSDILFHIHVSSFFVISLFFLAQRCTESPENVPSPQSSRSRGRPSCSASCRHTSSCSCGPWQQTKHTSSVCTRKTWSPGEHLSDCLATRVTHCSIYSISCKQASDFQPLWIWRSGFVSNNVFSYLVHKHNSINPKSQSFLTIFICVIVLPKIFSYYLHPPCESLVFVRLLFVAENIHFLSFPLFLGHVYRDPCHECAPCDCSEINGIQDHHPSCVRLSWLWHGCCHEPSQNSGQRWGGKLHRNE